MQSTDIATQVLALLTPIVSGGASVAQGVATKALGDMISQRLSHNEEGKQAWNGFQANPQNDSLICYLLRQELERDASFQLKVEAALRRASEEASGVVVQQTMSGGGSGNIQVGGSTGNIATNGGTIRETNVQNNNNTTNKKESGCAIVGVVAIVVVVVLVLLVFAGVKVVGNLLKPAKNGGLTADSTCQQFLNTDENDERQALADIGISEGFSGYSNPLALPEIQYECGSVPNMTLGALIKRDGNMA